MEHASSTATFIDAGASADERAIKGTGAASGIAIGTVYRYEASVPDVQREGIDEAEVEAELELLDTALDRAEQELETIQALAPDTLEADTEAIIDAQGLMLRDEEFLRAIRRRIRENQASAGRAVTEVLRAQREKLEQSEDPYLRDRTEDFVDLENRLLRSLRRGKVAAGIETHSIVVAEELTATDLLRFSRHSLLGSVTASGGATSHLSIVAKALNLPLLVGVPRAMDEVASGEVVILDGDEGRLIVNPDAETLDQYRQRRETHDAQASTQDVHLDEPTVTTDGHSMTLRANIGLETELELIEAYGADGVGLLRTELFFLATGDGTLAEDRQAALYQSVAETTGEEGAAIRLLDLGGEDRLPELSAGSREDNPFLGWRGIRMLLDRADDLLRPQLRALLRANRFGSLRVLLPMVATLDEVYRTRAILEEEAERLAAEGVPHDSDLPLGIVVEVPAAALQATAFAEHVDFFSIGTNDLTQYTLAADRGNDRVAEYHNALHPAVLGLIFRTVEAARKAGCPVEVCGEVAADAQAVPLLLGLGIDALSVSPQSLPAVHQMVRAVNYEDSKDLARTALEATDAETVRRQIQEWVDTHASSASDRGLTRAPRA